ncbi:MAG: lipopolysaccharide kinase InaA family protein [Candidatus Anammoxibacter sp.]
MRNNKHLPDNFTVIENDGVTIFAKESYKEALLNLDMKLFDFSENAGEVGDTGFVGRGHCLAVDLNGMDGRVVVRRYRHGGFLGVIVGDLFWNHARPLNELLVSEKALEMGLMTTRVVAVIKHNTLLFPFFKAEMVTEEIPDAFDLVRYIKDNKLTDVNLHKKKKEIIREVAIAVRKMHEIGIYHGDLHLKNILLKEEQNGKVCIYIMDFDKSTLHKSLNVAQRMKNLYRLDRSVEKLATLLRKQHDTQGVSFPISRTDRVRFFREYMRGYAGDDGEWRQLIKRGFSNYKLHKLRWHILEKVIS